MMLFRKLVHIFRTQQRPLKFLLAKILWKTNLCYLFNIQMEGYSLKYFPTALSAALWVSKEDRMADEMFLADYLVNGDVFLDIGANIGTHTLKAASIIGPTGKILSFEPHPKIYLFLNKNIHINRFCNIDTYNFALGKVSGYLDFSDTIADDQNRIISTTGIQVEVKRLDDFVNLAHVDLMKIDVEGYELFVLLGATKLLARTKCVIFESFEDNFMKYGYNTSSIIDFFIYNGFTVHMLSGNVLHAIKEGYTSTQCEILFAIRDIEEFLHRTCYKMA
jgi:FkbM family methyltransferase